MSHKAAGLGLWFGLLLARTLGAQSVELTRDDILDHIRGGWTGMLIGGIEGLAHEFKNLTRPELPRECKVSDQAALMFRLSEKLILANSEQRITIIGKPGYRVPLQPPHRLE